MHFWRPPAPADSWHPPPDSAARACRDVTATDPETGGESWDEEVACPERSQMHWGEYERVAWGRVLNGDLHTSAYCVRKGELARSGAGARGQAAVERPRRRRPGLQGVQCKPVSCRTMPCPPRRPDAEGQLRLQHAEMGASSIHVPLSFAAALNLSPFLSSPSADIQASGGRSGDGSRLRRQHLAFPSPDESSSRAPQPPTAPRRRAQCPRRSSLSSGTSSISRRAFGLEKRSSFDATRAPVRLRQAGSTRGAQEGPAVLSRR